MWWCSASEKVLTLLSPYRECEGVEKTSFGRRMEKEGMNRQNGHIDAPYWHGNRAVAVTVCFKWTGVVRFIVWVRVSDQTTGIVEMIVRVDRPVYLNSPKGGDQNHDHQHHLNFLQNPCHRMQISALKPDQTIAISSDLSDL